MAVSAHVSDSVVYDLMQDDRLCRRLPEVDVNMHLEVAYVNSLDPLVWTTLANLVGESGSPQQLMSDALVAAHAAAAYIDERLFVPARGMPFALCSGDVHMNLELLGRPGPMHEDEATQRIASLVRMRHSRAELVRLVSMFNELSWSSKKVEEDHAPGHKLRNHHNQYGQDMQLQRSFVCGLLSMVRQGKERAPLVRARKKLAILQKKQPRKATGRHMFSADALRATSAAYAGLSAEVRARAGADTMRRHGVQPAALSSDVKRDFQRRAATEAATRQHAINEEICAVRTCIFWKNSGTWKRDKAAVWCARLADAGFRSKTSEIWTSCCRIARGGLVVRLLLCESVLARPPRRLRLSVWKRWAHCACQASEHHVPRSLIG